ncbi:hypothetical protein EJ08DRAFT_623681 [Tothia fuscella]|uniref:Uncharacterized protein n=1 Tax=Tothia fuscella TaxID=1048955 RepID=A0A9P4U5M7_9PEZI|nr:hypothetical protein EJ08DRAFT_623681 [Tothia fuscella]
MGGNAFPNLKVLRLPHEIYNQLLTQCIAILKPEYYDLVFAPPEAPSKIDHGDIDLLVSSPAHVFTAKDLSSALGAVANTKVGVTTSFAILIPQEPATNESLVDAEQPYAQLDIHVCKEDYVEWETLLSSYGDLMQIIGVLNRAAGLTANDKGLHIRVPEIEKYNRKQSMLYLTHSVRCTLEFLGLDPKPYLEKTFTTDEEIFAWCVSGRFYGPKARDRENESANDRQRYAKRKMFTNCMNEWIPSHPEVWENRKVWTKEEVLAEAVRFFGIGKEYETMITAHRNKVAEEELIKGIQNAIPEDGQKLGEAMRGLKRFVKWDDGKLALCDDMGDVSDKPRWSAEIKEEQREGVLKWVNENWEELRRRERERMSIMKAKRDAENEKARQNAVLTRSN